MPESKLANSEACLILRLLEETKIHNLSKKTSGGFKIKFTPSLVRSWCYILRLEEVMVQKIHPNIAPGVLPPCNFIN